VKFILPLALLSIAGCSSRASGDAEATGTLQYVEIDVAPVTAARVVRVTRREGETVREGDTLVVLTQATVVPNVDAMQARVKTAEAHLRELLAGPRQTDIAGANAELRAAEADADKTARDVERLRPLAANGNISHQQFDAAQAAARTAAARRDAAQQALKELTAGTRPEEIDGARSELAYAQAAVRAASATKSDMVLTSPISGSIISRAAEPGEVAVPGVPTMTIADAARPFVRVFVNQMVLPSLHVGGAASATLDAFPDRHFTGKITAIGTKAEYTPRVALTRDERADLVFAVRVEFVDSSGTLKSGLPITVRFTGARK
jgi:HlyD family secretion protein